MVSILIGHINNLIDYCSVKVFGHKVGTDTLYAVSAGFVPKVLNTSVYDEIITVTEEDSYAAGRLTGASEGVLVGISAGAALHAAIEVASRVENEGKTVVVLLPDTGTRYLSTELFEK